MLDPPLRYDSGELIQTGDRITFASSSGRVVWVYDDANPDEDWSYLGRGFLIEAEGYGRVHLHCDEQNEDLILLGRELPDDPTGTGR